MLQLPVNVEGVVVVATVAHQPRPPAPPRGHVVARVPVEVLPVVRSHVAGVLNRSYSLETRGKELVTPSYKQQSAIYGDIIDHIPLYHIPQYLQVGCEGALLVRVSPGAGAAVVVVGEDVVVVDVEPGQQGGARRTTHRCGHVAVLIGDSFLSQ